MRILQLVVVSLSNAKGIINTSRDEEMGMGPILSCLELDTVGPDTFNESLPTKDVSGSLNIHVIRLHVLCKN